MGTVPPNVQDASWKQSGCLPVMGAQLCRAEVVQPVPDTINKQPRWF